MNNNNTNQLFNNLNKTMSLNNAPMFNNFNMNNNNINNNKNLINNNNNNFKPNNNYNPFNNNNLNPFSFNKNNFLPNNNLNKNLLPQQNNFNNNLNKSMFNIQNNNNFIQNKNKNKPFEIMRLYACPKCKQKIPLKEKEDHILCHILEENDRRRPIIPEPIRNRIRLSSNNNDSPILIVQQNHNHHPRRIFIIGNNSSSNPISTIINNMHRSPLNLPEITLDDVNKLEEANKKCMVCLEDFKSKEKVTALPCLHYFHPACIKEWMKEKNECPICKFELTQENLNKKMKYIYE